MLLTRNELLFLVKGLSAEIKEFIDGTSCDHLGGLCYCSAFRLLEEADSALKEVRCFHTDTYHLPDLWPDGHSIEVCNCCGRSRSHWEQGESNWIEVDLYSARAELEGIMGRWLDSNYA